MIKDVTIVMVYVAVIGIVGCITAAGLMGCTGSVNQGLPVTVQAAVFVAQDDAAMGR